MYDRSVKTFVQVVELGSFSKAAEAGYTSAATVMNQINGLEKEIGYKLLSRNNKGIELTESGRIYYDYAKRIMAETDEVLNKLKYLSASKKHEIRIGTSILNPCEPLIHICNQLKKQHPEYTIRIVPFSDTKLIELVNRLGTEVDFFMGVMGSRKIKSMARFYELERVPHCVAMRPDHPLADREYISLQDMNGYKIMMCAEGDSPEVDGLHAWIGKYYPGVTIIDAAQYYDMNVFNKAEEENNLLLSFDFWDKVHPSLISKPLEWDGAVTYGIVRAAKPRPDAEIFWKMMKEGLEDGSLEYISVAK